MIAEKHPELVGQLPLFYALLVDSEDNIMGMMTQDFSERGNLGIVEYADFSHPNIPDGIVNLFDPFMPDNMVQLEHMLFYANGKRKIGDLDHSMPKEEFLLDWAGFKNIAESEGHVLVYRRPTVEELFSDDLQLTYANKVIEACQEGEARHSCLVNLGIEEGFRLGTEINKVLDLMAWNYLLNATRDPRDVNRELVYSLPS